MKKYLIAAKLPPPNEYKIQLKGMKKCPKSYLSCTYIREVKEIKGNLFTWKIYKRVTCQSNNLSNIIICTKESCQQKNEHQQKYIGETEKKLKDRICEHIGYINTKKIDQATENHFNLPSHSLSNMKVTVLENVHKRDPE